VNWDVASDPPAIQRLHDIHVPTLAIVGDLDSPDFDTIASLISAKVPGARKVVIRGAGHMPNMEKPDEFNTIVRDFLRSIDR
jgi:pimeloyl-ACP methyl ester carboxylesterase